MIPWDQVRGGDSTRKVIPPGSVGLARAPPL